MPVLLFVNSMTAFAKTSIVAAGAFCTNKSPCSPCSKAYNTRSTASSRVIMNLVISGFVMVIGFPSLIWFKNKGITLPRLAITLP